MSLAAPVVAQRELFDIPADIAYFNCAYMSPLLRSVRQAGEAGVARKSQPWKVQSTDFFTESEVTRQAFAQLIGGDTEDVAIIPAVSYGTAVAAANLPIRAGQHIVLLADEFPSDVYAWQDLARHSGATIVTVPFPTDYDWTTALLKHIDERTGIVVTPNCHWTDGSLIDLPRVSTRVREVGAALVVDATQSLGAYPLDVSAIRPDFLITANYKWLLGPYSMGFMYVDPRHRDGKPLEMNWLTRAGSENFSGLTAYRDDFQPGARRFDVGQRSNFALMPMALAGMQQLLDWGVPQVAMTIRQITDHIANEATRLGCEVAPAHLRADHMIGLRFSKGVPANLSARLAQANVFVSLRGVSLRVSPHVYNTPEDIQRFIKVLAEAV